MIPKDVFGRTGHKSSRVIFGGYALSQATQNEGDRVLEILLKYGINHIDTAPMYGNSEKCIGAWMDKHRSDFFVATKSRHRTYREAWEDLQHSLDLLRVDYVDLWQLHGLTNPAGWETAIGPGGALEAFIEAREKGLVRFLGVTGHSDATPIIHKKSLEHFNFDSVMLPYSYCQMQNSRYERDFNGLIEFCHTRNVAIQTIKSIARRPWVDRPKNYNTYFYEPLETQDAIDLSVYWALGLPGSFVITAGDIQLLPRILEAANRYETCPSDAEMDALIEKYDVRPIFTPAPRDKRGKGPQTWGGRTSRAIDELIRDGFFRHSGRRTLAQVLEALEMTGLPVTGRENNVTGSLAGRVRKGILKKSKVDNQWVYWQE